MSFTSGTFLIFFPFVVLFYFLIPHRYRYIWLLLASYYFYMGWNAEYALLIFTSTIITYISGVMLERIKQSAVVEQQKVFLKKCCVAVSVVLNLGILGYFKYTQFFYNSACKFFSFIGVYIPPHQFDILLPVGISFYTFQALSYSIDVYRDEIYAEKNFFKYALFVSFFPQLVAGPIERSKHLLVQINEEHHLEFITFRDGLLTMLWGYFLKIVIADRITIFVDTIYGNYDLYGGWYLIIASILFSIQIYCDFNGYTMIACGAAKIMGFRLMRNFDAPYLSTSTAEFWRRWHISLTSWFKDYLYIPLGGSRKGKFRKYINKIIVFLVSGLWHGASMSFVIWGGLNGIYQVFGEMTFPLRKRIQKLLHINTENISTKLVQGLFTFVLIDFSWIFFRANSLSASIDIIMKICTVKNRWILFDGSLYNCGLSQKNFYLMMAAIGILLAVDICRRVKVDLLELFQKQDTWFRCLFFVFFITFIMLFGLYGPSYDSASFIYFQF